jgi:hypothetical protein
MARGAYASAEQDPVPTAQPEIGREVDGSATLRLSQTEGPGPCRPALRGPSRSPLPVRAPAS